MMKCLVVYFPFPKKVDYNNRGISHSTYEVISSSLLAGIIARKYKINVNIVNKKWQMSTNLVYLLLNCAVSVGLSHLHSVNRIEVLFMGLLTES